MCIRDSPIRGIVCECPGIRVDTVSILAPGKSVAFEVSVDIPFDKDSLREVVLNVSSRVPNWSKKYDVEIPVVYVPVKITLVAVSDAPGGMASGNNNGKLEKGETIEARFKVWNDGDKAIKGAKLHLADCPGIRPVQNDIEVPPLGPGERDEISVSFYIEKTSWKDVPFNPVIELRQGPAILARLCPSLVLSGRLLPFPVWVLWIIVGALVLVIGILAIAVYLKKTLSTIATASQTPTPSYGTPPPSGEGRTPTPTPTPDEDATVLETMHTITKALERRYVLIKRLGEGGMGQVYLAEDTRLKRKVAFKVMKPELVYRRRERERFLREARIAAKLNHPNIVSIYDIGEDREDMVYLVFEYVDGKPLNEILDDRGKLGLDIAKKWAVDILRALDYAHSEGVIHRDLKPANVMIEKKRMCAKLLDFGVARVAADTLFSLTGAVVGTPAYMAPEQHLGEEADARTDIFSFGVMFYEMLSGEILFRGGDPLAQKERKKYPHITKYVPNAPDWVVEVIEKCLEPERENRWQSAREILEVIGE